MVWDVAELRRKVLARYGEEQERIVEACIRKIADRRGFARYHYHLAMDRLDELVIDGAPTAAAAMMTLASDRFHDVRFIAHANIVACVQSMHAVSDNMLHLLYHALGMDRAKATALAVHNIDWKHMRTRLPNGRVHGEMAAWIDHPDHVYLDGLCNHSKHRSIIQARYGADLEEDVHGLRFLPFEYRGTQHLQRWVKPFLLAEYARQETHIHALADALDAELA